MRYGKGRFAQMETLEADPRGEVLRSEDDEEEFWILE